jgi:hypothetical protein
MEFLGEPAVYLEDEWITGASIKGQILRGWRLLAAFYGENDPLSCKLIALYQIILIATNPFTERLL